MTESQITILAIPLVQVRPDPSQPRRLLPEDLAERLVQGGSPSDILTEMRTRAERDKWLREKLAELDGLADSIAADGLMQPIRVYREGENQYRIEEGERRWWAHHVLVGRGRQEFSQITAILVTTTDEDKNLLRRRVAENVHRSGFTAIELAQAMSQRVEAMLADEPGTKRREAERRVAIENQMTDRRVRQYVALLTLSPAVQDLAQQARLSENALRVLVGIKNAGRQLEKARELANPSVKTRRSAAHSRAKKSATTRTGSRKREVCKRTRKAAAFRSSVPAKRASGISPSPAIRDVHTKSIEIRFCELVAIAKELLPTRLEDLDQQNWDTIIKSPDDLRAIDTLCELIAYAAMCAQDTHQHQISTPLGKP